MGQHADDLLDQMIQADWPFHIPKPKWSTKDGRVIYVEEMLVTEINRLHSMIEDIKKHIN